MATPNILQMQNEARSRQIAEEVAASAVIGQPQTPTTVFPSGNDAALAASINELKERDIEYKRLQSEEARQQWENAARQNLQRNQTLESQRADRQALDQAQNQAISDDRVTKLLTKAGELEARLAAAAKNGPLTEHNVPLDLLREQTQTLQELDRAAKERGYPGFDAPTPQQQYPDAFEDGSKVKITQNADGTLEARLITGEIFKGDPLTVAQKLGEAQVNTKRWGQQQRAAASQQPQTQQQTQTQTQPQPQNGNPSHDSPN